MDKQKFKKWLNTELKNDYTVFDKIIDIYSELEYDMEANNIIMNKNKKLVIMRFALLLFKHSHS